MKNEKIITRSITMTEENWEHCKSIADDLESIATGNFVNVDGEAVEVNEDDEGEYVIVDGERVDADEFEPFTLWDWFNDCFDIKYTVNSDLEYSGVSVMVACGGPNIYIDTNVKKVLLYWWTDYAEYDLSRKAVNAIDEIFEEYYNCTR